jgi:hypothetical protein
LFFNSKWDTLSVLNIENEKHFVSKNHGTAPLKGILVLHLSSRASMSKMMREIDRHLWFCDYNNFILIVMKTVLVWSLREHSVIAPI